MLIRGFYSSNLLEFADIESMQDSTHAHSARTGFWLLVGLLALFAACKPILFDTLDPDCFWHLRVADQLRQDGIGPLVDRLSFASTKQPWTPYSWLAELGMKSIWDIGGYRAAIAVTAIIQGSIILLLAACCLEIQTQPKYFASAVATAIGILLILPYLSFRPVTFGFLVLFTIVWIILRDQKCNSPSRNARDRSTKIADSPSDPRPSGPGYQKTVWIIVPLTILLTNIHLFSFFVPAILLAMALGAMLEANPEQVARYSILSTATLLACLATPMLPGLIKTIFFYSAHDQMVAGPVIAEMQSFARGPFGWLAALVVLSMLICIATGYRSLRIGQLICVAVSTPLLLKLGRFAPLFALVACPAFAATVPALKDRLLAKPAIAAALGCVLIISIGRVTLSFPGSSVPLSTWLNRHGPDTPGYPCAAADFLDHSVPSSTGHLINEFSWGGYLAWRLDGKYQVLLDGRTQVFPPSLWRATYLGTDTDRAHFLSNVQADAALVPAQKSKFRDALLQLGWTSAFKDDRAEVLLPPGHFARLE